MPKLVQINSTINWGSTGKIAEQIATTAIERGWESYIAYGRNGDKSRSHPIHIGSATSRAWHLLQSRLMDRHGLGSRCATKRLVRQLQEIDPDIVHLHNLHGYYINYPILFDYLETSRAKVVWTLHDCWAYTGHCAHYITTDCRKWQDGCSDCQSLKSYPRCYDLGINNRTAQNFERKKSLFTSLGDRLTLVPVSEWLAEQTRQSFFSNSAIKPIYNGIDISIFRERQDSDVRQRLGIGKMGMVVGVASTWCEHKGWNDYMKLRRALPQDSVIVLVGVNQRQKRTLPEGIIGVERTTSQEELAKIYSTADVVLSLSRQETFGLTIAEGMACGTPAIVYNTTALPELITPETGFVVEKGDIAAVADAIAEVRKHGKAHYAAACRKYAEEHFDKNRCFAQYIRLYDEILTK